MVKVETFVSEDFGENTYLAERGGEKILIDPGLSAGKNLPAREEIKYVLLTHGHYDHIKGVSKEWGDIVFAHMSEKELLRDASKNLSAFIGEEIVLDNINYYSGEKYEMDGIEFYHTPGHTPGSVVIKIGNVCFTGDTLFEDTVGRTDLPGSDPRALQKSLCVFDAFDADTVMYPGHGRPFKLPEAYKKNYFLKNGKNA
ncbi:MAG: MBL fold metallo-hydrolase [Candidatus Goldiibacteriota bacterium]